MFCKNIKKSAWETVFFGIVFVLWLVEQGSPPPPFHHWCHACTRAIPDGLVKKQKKGSTLGKLDERIKDILFVFDAERKKCK